MMKKFWTTALGSFVGVWLALTLFSVLSVIFSFAFIGAIANMGATLRSVEKNTILHIDLRGQLTERESGNDYASSLIGVANVQQEQSLSTLVKALKAAKDNDNVKGVYVECNGIEGDIASLQELRRALVDFKESNKFVYAYGDVMGQGDYYVASAADSVFINTIGGVDLHGLASSTPYFKTLLDKIGVEMQVLRVGTFKSAVEPYMLNEMSEANRLQQESYLGSIWSSIVGEISESRKIKAENINQYVDSLISTRQSDEFVKAKLVDAVCYRHEIENKLRKLTGLKADEELKLATPAEVAATATSEKTSERKVAVFYAVGEIFDDGDADGVNARELTESIIEASTDDDVKAVVLRVNSPGGSAFGSEQIWAALQEVKKAGKPFAVSMGGYAASGGYYISCGADRIFAEPTTVTGSIGVFGLVPCFESLATDKLGVNFCGVATNPNAVMSTMKRLTPFQRERMQQSVNDFYELFTSRCATGRHMPIDSLKAIAEGRVWDGATALKLKLVDEYGDLAAAVKWVAAKADLGDDYEVTYQPDPEDKWLKLIKQYAEMRAEEKLKENLGVLYQYHKEIKGILSRDPMQCRMEPVEIR